jgi:hypothetical protein
MIWRRRRRTGDGEPAGETPPALPAHDPQEMLNAWLRALTIVGEHHTPAQAMELIAMVNQPQTISVQIRTPLPPDDAQALNDSLAWQHEARSRQAGVHLLVETLLIRWLAEATGQTWSQIVQRLALELHNTLPPGPYPSGDPNDA